MSTDTNIRVMGPNEQYARWDNSKITFSRREMKNNDANQYVGSITRKLMAVPHTLDFLKIIPAEPVLPIIGKNMLLDNGTRIDLTTQQREKIRLALINARILNWKWMDFQKYDGKVRQSTPYFLNMLGKYYYTRMFKKSPDSMTKSYYRNHVIKNRVMSVRHIQLITEYYEKYGHDVKLGQYPFDIIVDNKHGFVLPEQHENSIGIEMRFSEAIHQCNSKNMILYVPSMSPEIRRRVSAIIAGILFHSNHMEHFSYISYLEPEICADIRINDWSYYLTNSKERGAAMPPTDTLPFPKINDLYSQDLVDTQINDIKTPEYIQNTTYTFKTQYINNLNNTEIVPGVKVTVGVGMMGDLWNDMAKDSDVIVTGMCRDVMLKPIYKYPDVLVANSLSEGKRHLEIMSRFEKHGSEILQLPMNHGKAILNKNRLLVHSMTTSSYMGNNRESYALIDFNDHPQKTAIHDGLFWMLYHFGNNNEKEYIREWKNIKELFENRIGLFAHFHSNRVLDWVYYKEIKKIAGNLPITIYTSHLDMKKYARMANEIRIQGTSRFANHQCYSMAKCPVLKERMWHPRIVFNNNFVGVGSWDFSQIKDQKELQVVIYQNYR
ncbi:MAG: hypothetical protein Q7J10_03030 [Methanosarcinaceae archaeon]|nr:hypothetical protein [Methanosarcinaceae archaeon]